ncbi:MAG: VOC family protein [Acidobacteriia bacterium]|nr:VOC family protein [Terriglobia bacterium]MBV8903927.1 VOC family protein [Terriglobia bacterium]MBV9745723.1 VOC family protein [Terriglobia bacterium]
MTKAASLLVGLLAGQSMNAVDLKVDHVTAAGKDLTAMRRALEAAGLPSEYGGPHANHATEMALTSFPDGSYLELIAIQPHADPSAVAASPWHRCMEGNAGPCGWAVRPADLGAETERLRKTSVAVSAPAKNGRSRPDGVQLNWETVQVGTGNGDFFPFLIHDFTPRERRAYPSGKPTTAKFTGVVKVVLSVKNMDDAIAQYRRAYGLAPPRRQEDPKFGAHLAWFEGTPVVLAAPDGPQSWLAERLNSFGEAPCAFILGRSGSTMFNGNADHISVWFEKRVVWFSPETLGWRLGEE